MTAASLIGFALVFVLVAAVTSGAAALWLRVRRGAHAHSGPAVERRAAELAAALPIMLATAVVAILAVDSAVGPDHCSVHGHHAHLCLWHGAVWIERASAVAAVVAAAAVVATRGALLAAGVLRAHRTATRLRATGHLAHGAHLVPSERVFCFVAGLRRPTIFASTAAHAALPAPEWRAMLAHEHSHVRHGDLARRVRLELLLLVAAPLAGLAIRHRWDVATERLRDADASEDIGSRETVASALVRMARHATQLRLAPAASFIPNGDAVLAQRVRALLEPVPRGHRAAARLARTTLGGVAAIIALALAFADPLHHALETLLG